MVSNFLWARSRLRELFNCKGRQFLMKKEDWLRGQLDPRAGSQEQWIRKLLQGEKPDPSGELDPESGWQYLANFQNCYRLVTAVCLPFPAFWTEVSIALILPLVQHCVSCIITCLFSSWASWWRGAASEMPHSHLGLVCYYQTLDLTASAIQKDNLGEAGSVFCTSVCGRVCVHCWGQRMDYGRMLPNMTAHNSNHPRHSFH